MGLAAGLTLAHAMRDAGLAVLVVESGPVDDPEALDAGEVVGHTYNGLLRGRVSGVGGTTAVWPGASSCDYGAREAARAHPSAVILFGSRRHEHVRQAAKALD